MGKVICILFVELHKYTGREDCRMSKVMIQSSGECSSVRIASNAWIGNNFAHVDRAYSQVMTRKFHIFQGNKSGRSEREREQERK